jgi:hypothetical protein
VDFQEEVEEVCIINIFLLQVSRTEVTHSTLQADNLCQSAQLHLFHQTCLQAPEIKINIKIKIEKVQLQLLLMDWIMVVVVEWGETRIAGLLRMKGRGEFVLMLPSRFVRSSVE